MRVLLVDDEQELVSTLVERLSFRGIEADWATNGEEALSLADKKTYDLAVLDIKMPGMSGFRLKNELQNRFPKMKFIFLTGHGSLEDYHKGTSETGSEFYLVKPIDISALIQKMHEIVQRQEDSI